MSKREIFSKEENVQYFLLKASKREIGRRFSFWREKNLPPEGEFQEGYLALKREISLQKRES